MRYLEEKTTEKPERKNRYYYETLHQNFERLTNPLRMLTESPHRLYAKTVRELESQNRSEDVLQFWNAYREIEEAVHGLNQEHIWFFRFKNLLERYNEALLNSVSDLIGNFINRLKYTGIPEQDLKQVISIGVVLAIQTYDPLKGASFPTHTYIKIQGEISRIMAERLQDIGISSKDSIQYSLYVRRCDKFFQDLGRMPTPEEIVEQYPDEFTLDVAMGFYQAYLLRSAVSINAPLASESGLPLEEQIEDPTAYAAINFVGEMEAYLKFLSPRERQIIEIYYGLTGNPPITNLAAIADLPEIKVSRERIRQNYAKAIGKILNAIKENLIY